jgi:hypothetical protein
MAVFTLVAEYQGKSFACQVIGSSAEEAVSLFLSSVYPNACQTGLGPQAPELTDADVIYITPMTNLVNVWAVSTGKSGKYVSVVCVLTAAQAGA